MAMQSKLSLRMKRRILAATKSFALAFGKLLSRLERFAPMGYQDEDGFHLDTRDRSTQ
jgi:hypothetical protein